MKNIAVIFAHGFEEIEAVTQVDTLRRLGCPVITVGLESREVTGAHGIQLITDTTLAELDVETLEALVLPGGQPGSCNLRDSEKLLGLIQKMNAEKKWICAICGAPIALAKAGILEGKQLTCYPDKAFWGPVEAAGGHYTAARTEHNGNLITGKGPGAALEFAFAIGSALGLKDAVERVKKEMVFQP